MSIRRKANMNETMIYVDKEMKGEVKINSDLQRRVRGKENGNI